MVSKKYIFTGNQFPVYEHWKNPVLIYWKFCLEYYIELETQ